MKWVLVTGLISFLLVSCQRENEFSREMASIDHLLTVLDITLNELTSVDTSDYRLKDEKITGNIRQITSGYVLSGDTMSGDVARLLAKYRNQRLPADAIFNFQNHIASEIVYTKKQLLDLKHDTQHNLLDAETVKESYNRELAATEKVISEATNWLELFNLKTISDPGTENEIDSLITALNDIS